jgi:hypothetical protein
MQCTTGMMAMVAVALTAAGCGSGDGIPRHTVSGKVTLDGKPLEDGQITFTPELAGNPAAGATIKAGAYRLGRSEGPAAGPHRVNIWARRPTGKKTPSDVEPGTFVEETREIIPNRYNVNSELKADIKDSGGNRFDFALTSKKPGT